MAQWLNRPSRATAPPVQPLSSIRNSGGPEGRASSWAAAGSAAVDSSTAARAGKRRAGRGVGRAFMVSDPLFDGAGDGS